MVNNSNVARANTPDPMTDALLHCHSIFNRAELIAWISLAVGCGLTLIVIQNSMTHASKSSPNDVAPKISTVYSISISSLLIE